MSRTTPVAAEAARYMNDEHWGKGGRYILDPATGRRTPVVEALPPPAEGIIKTPVDGNTLTADTTTSSTAKGKRHG